ncbi:MAG TPA: SDR family NAD(P)-dependent oxidoreductase [Candidatus Onthousia faecipullorum]|uniref:SDR family NAD(P)-dependent oxidoreductase n=1 Tax=Candidatus Onthousia faecipullorum TaxID=2840887 RepID=A0A9D1GB31_9FIRM|nr:SDR family NAD(P)-dependent oxidoreductase [Candidatus Onthousia faecipullorum]
MKAMITGASSGIGRDIALNLAKLHYDLILVGRNKEALEDVKSTIDGKVKVKIIVVDLSNLQKVKELYVLTRNDDIDILVNNAGFGVFGEFYDIDINTELNMLDVNIRALDMLCKFYLKDMIKKDRGVILNVSSTAFMSGPLMSSYYASKSYVYRLSLAINEELRRRKSKVTISVLCPGPVDTNFNNRAGVEFGVKALSSSYVARYAVEKMFSGKTIIIPGFKMKFVKFIVRFLPDKFVTHINYNIQKKKGK